MSPTYSITYLETIPSTNDEMLARIRAGSAAPGEVIVAREQTRGRGRMGRQWSSEEGGLWFTAAMPLPGEHLGWAGMLAALAVCRALDEIGLRASVKWPNDGVVEGKKLAGVLVEMVAGRDLAAVGVGLNVSNPLPQVGSAATLWPPTSVSQETGRDIDPWSLLEPILARMSELWRVWESGGLAELQAAWSARDVCRGHRVRLVPDGPEGVAAGIDHTGALRVRLPDGRETLARAGELAFLDRERRGL